MVLDCGQVYQAPYAGLLMAKAGANVVKIEPPNGEPLRAREAVGEGAALRLAILNSNKRPVSLNLKHSKGVALLKAMARRAAVLKENFAAGVMDRLGVGYEALSADNPRLFYAGGRRRLDRLDALDRRHRRLPGPPRLLRGLG